MYLSVCLYVTICVCARGHVCVRTCLRAPAPCMHWYMKLLTINCLVYLQLTTYQQ